jgi:hypothetical protein
MLPSAQCEILSGCVGAAGGGGGATSTEKLGEPPDSESALAHSSVHADVVQIGRRSNLPFVQVRDGGWNRHRLLQVFFADVRRMNLTLCGCRGRRCWRWREHWRLEPLQPGWFLNREYGDCEQQAQSKGLHGKGCDRSPSATGRLVPGAFECAEHSVLRNGPVIPYRHLRPAI